MRVFVLVALTGCDQLFNLDDVAPPRADAFDIARDCPGYDLELFAGSRYRIAATATAPDAADDCDDDVPGLTHLAVAETRTELDNIRGALEARAATRWWIGLVQPADETTLDGGWRWVTGAPFDPAMWGTTPVIEPNDNDRIENGGENFGGLQRTFDGIVDYVQGQSVPALCECDGRATGAAEKLIVDQLR